MISQPGLDKFNMISLLKVVNVNSDFNVSRQHTVRILDFHSSYRVTQHILRTK